MARLTPRTRLEAFGLIFFLGALVISVVTALTAGAAPLRTSQIGISSVPVKSVSVSNRWPANPYPLGSLWHPAAPIGAAVAVDPNSRRYVSFWLSHLVTPKLVIGPWSVPVVTVTGHEPRYTIKIVANGHGASNVNRYGPVPIPSGTKPDASGDGHLALISYRQGIEWDLWQARYDASSNTWTATCGSALHLSERATPANICGSNTAGIPAAAGLVTPEEIAAGQINHPLVFAADSLGTPRGDRYRCPATASWGNSNDPSALVAGMWLQLDPSLDIETIALAPWEKTIARALQQYGAYARDQTGDGDADFYADNTQDRNSNPTWAQLGITGNTPFSKSFPWNRMRLLEPPCTTKRNPHPVLRRGGRKPH